MTRYRWFRQCVEEERDLTRGGKVPGDRDRASVVVRNLRKGRSQPAGCLPSPDRKSVV